MLGDVAVMVHPEDERYRHLIGKHVDAAAVRPRRSRSSPTTTSTASSAPACVKVTPRARLQRLRRGPAPRPADDRRADARREDQRQRARARTAGSTASSRARRCVADLEAQGLLVKTKKHKLMVPRCARTGQVVEPMLTDQWFVAMTKPGDATASRIAAEGDRGGARPARCSFVPENWVNTYNQWMKNIQDWCISRQLWWGHQIPAWYDDGRQRLRRAQRRRGAPRRRPPGNAGCARDPDVLDTWYSSALVPFSTLGWPAKTKELELFLPSTVLVTGYDIIFFWVARMIMMTTHFTGQVPFRDVYIHGLVRDSHGKKMSKSRRQRARPGRPDRRHRARAAARQAHHRPAQARDRAARCARTPQKEFPNGIPAFGADALRFTFARSRPRPQHQLRHQALRGLPQLLQQALERDPLRADELRRPGLRPRRSTPRPSARRASRSTTT